MKSSFCIDLQRFMLIPTKFPLSPEKLSLAALAAPFMLSAPGAPNKVVSFWKLIVVFCVVITLLFLILAADING